MTTTNEVCSIQFELNSTLQILHVTEAEPSTDVSGHFLDLCQRWILIDAPGFFAWFRQFRADAPEGREEARVRKFLQQHPNGTFGDMARFLAESESAE